MDPRGAGIWDGKPLHSTEAAMWALDAAEAGKDGRVSNCILFVSFELLFSFLLIFSSHTKNEMK